PIASPSKEARTTNPGRLTGDGSPATRSVARTLLPWLLLALALLLAGCGPTPGPPVETPPNSVSPEAVQAILNWFVTHRNVNWQTGSEAAKRFNEHKGFFVVRRAMRLLGYGPASWGTETNYTTVINRIDSEFGE